MKYVDLFAGCGGLSLGIENAGGQLVAAVEKSDMAARTFYHNSVGDMSDLSEWEDYIRRPLSVQMRGKVIVSELAKVLADDEVMSSLAGDSLDLVVGGPPCQGFSLAGRRNHDDIRNRLAWEYLDFVAATRPKAVVIENVVGMSRKFESQSESSFAQLRRALAQTGPGYVVQAVLVNAMHYGAPQHRPRLMLIALRQDVADLLGIQVGADIWKSTFTDSIVDKPSLAPMPVIANGCAFSVGDAVADLFESPHKLPTRNAVYRERLGELARNVASSRSQSKPNNHTFRTHTARVVSRFSLYRALAEAGADAQLPNRLAGLNLNTATALATELLTGRMEFPITLQVGSGPHDFRTFAKLDEFAEFAASLATKKHSQKVLSWVQPARTVVTLPDDYVHPLSSRIFTVRELARFQGFPDDFEFLGKETTGSARRKFEVPQYTQVGNAVSPWLSLAVGRLIQPLIEEFNDRVAAIAPQEMQLAAN
ncbi:DNA cytosine methyltransferase [Pseudarthrobacter sp. J1738]|uniref:DNA cytosine methyltransferase n=1 Tax=Pseudarthrobacter sp. J1738 TaxID=3420446 RepID=UPI003D2B46FC